MKILPNFKNIFTKEVSQIIYGVLLIFIIPSLIVFNTVYIIGKYNQNIDISLQKQALSIGRIVYAEMKSELNNPDAWQQKIENIYNQSQTLLELEILVPNQDSYIIVASSNKEKIGKSLDSNYYRLSWQMLENDALATAAEQLTMEDKESLDVQMTNERFWLVAMPMRDQFGNKAALLSIKISSEIVDSATSASRNASLYLLALTTLIVILFLFIATRLWDYALLYQKIKEVDTMKDEFISMASHELRTPLTAIRGYISMVMEGSMGPVNEKVMQGLKRVKASSERLHSLVEDLLNVSRIEQNRIEFSPQKINPTSVIQAVVEELSLKAKRKNLKLLHIKQQNLPNIYIDKDKLHQILINIIGNSIKYTLKGKIEITTESKGGSLTIRVKDTGIGMNTEQKKRLFEKFYRVKDERTKKVPGTGLGLWVTKQLIELQKGKIMVDSIENVGTQVSISFPVLKK
ncbi:HAMP domain-containing histidine kinase [Patescibacteria group bacterium]|nr:HAMP domain-containing histidine kinase [Patescibacteria group bacterium]